MPKGKDYGHDHGRDNAFGLKIVDGPIPGIELDFVEFGELGAEGGTFSSQEGRQHASGEEVGHDVTARRLPKDAGQTAYMNEWLEAFLRADAGVERKAIFYKRGPGDTIALAEEVGTIFPKARRPSGGNRTGSAAASEMWTFFVYGCRPMVI